MITTKELSFEELGFEDLKVGDRIQIKFKHTPNRANRTYEIRAFVDDRMVIRDNRGFRGYWYGIVDIYWWHVYAKDNCKVHRKSS